MTGSCRDKFCLLLLPTLPILFLCSPGEAEAVLVLAEAGAVKCSEVRPGRDLALETELDDQVLLLLLLEAALETDLFLLA